MDEENTKVRLIQPFLELLGWNLYSTEVELEYKVPMATGSSHVDYALLVGDSPVVFVEVKPVRSDLSNRDIQQLKSYMRQELDVDWGILTNGKVFEVLTKSPQRGDGGEVSVVRFDLDDLGNNPDMLELLSKESIRSGRSDEIAKQVARTNEVIRYLENEEGSVTQSVASAIKNEVGEVPIDLHEQSREFVQNLASVLREKRQFVSDSQTDEDPDQLETEPDRDRDTSDDLKPLEDNVAGTIQRTEIDGDGDAKVAVFPTRKSGLPFLKENEAWGFVRVGQEFDYVAMYVTDDVKEVRYFAEVDKIIDKDEADLMRDPMEYVDRAKIAEDKMVIEFEPGSLYELSDPIPFSSKYPQGLRYTTLSKLRNAETTDELL